MNHSIVPILSQGRTLALGRMMATLLTIFILAFAQVRVSWYEAWCIMFPLGFTVIFLLLLRNHESRCDHWRLHLAAPKKTTHMYDKP